jgi:nucleotide-binding universal stress UspA family protein
MRVLVASDGSECAAVAVELVAELEWPTKTVIEVIEAVPSGTAVFGGPWPPMSSVDMTAIDRSIRQQAARNLDEAAATLARSGRAVETVAVSGRPGDIIVSQAEQHDADLIVVGSRGHGALETMLLGSVSAEVIDHAHVPVLVARRRHIERVVFAWDGSDRAEAAVKPLTEWGVFAGAHIDVLSIADAEPPWWVRAGIVSEDVAAEAYHEAAEPSRRQHEEMAEQMAEWLRTAGLTAVPLSREGDPAETIVAFAAAHDVDLIVLGTHGRTGVRRLLMGSVARNVVIHAPCSVLLAR